MGTATPGPASESAVALLDHELVVEDGRFSTDAHVDARLRNAGGVASGSVDVAVNWYDAAGNYLDNDVAYLRSIGPGETWAARVDYLGGDGGEVADYEIDATYVVEPPSTNPPGLSVVGSEMVVVDDQAVISGRVENARPEAAPYVEAVGKVYDASGVVLGDEWTNVTDVPAGRTWAFELSWWVPDRVGEAADHAVWITDSAY